MDDPNRLHPDGAPGIAEAQYRRMYGDAGYEALRDAAKTEQALLQLSDMARIERFKAMSSLIGAVTFAVITATLIGVGFALWWWV